MELLFYLIYLVGSIISSLPVPLAVGFSIAVGWGIAYRRGQRAMSARVRDEMVKRARDDHHKRITTL